MADGVRVVLQVDVPGLGNAGDVLIISPSKANELFRAGLLIAYGDADNAPGPKAYDRWLV